MRIMKFGGTSLGSASRMKEVAQLIQQEDIQKIVVLSAVSGTTNALVKVCQCYYQQDKTGVRQITNQLSDQYQLYVKELFEEGSARNEAWQFVDEKLKYIAGFEEITFNQDDERIILAQGEIISTNLMLRYLEAVQKEVKMLPAFKFMRTQLGVPDMEKTEALLMPLLEAEKQNKLFITQGYICLNEHNKVDNLKRGGSDYTASILGGITNADEIQIWTDIDGLHNNDPRIVPNTSPVRELSFDEAAELAYFGAKILHPATILPAQQKNIKVRLKNTMQPEAAGTLISAESVPKQVKAIAAKDGITAIKVKSHRMLLAYGFLNKIFAVFEQYQTPIDMVATSEVAVSLTIDDTTHLAEITKALQDFGAVVVDSNQTIVCIVGHFLQEENGLVAKVLNALSDTSIRMVSYGGSKNNISILIHEQDKHKALQALNLGLFGK